MDAQHEGHRELFHETYIGANGSPSAGPARREPCAAEAPEKGLSLRQRQVLDMAARGLAQKVIAYELGIAASTVSTHLRMALDRLRIERAEVALLVATSSGSVHPSRIEPPDLCMPPHLSAAEKIVVRGMIEGHSNLQIARQRRRSVRTVANQVASAFRKLGIGSRAELYARRVEWLQRASAHG
jgi:DNA-binding CsgD family transcriptional regulator